jgi:hypothetical protein
LNVEFPPASRLSGRVVRGEKPVAFKSVTAFPKNSESAAATGETDQNGLYTIMGLSEGDYVISLGSEWKKPLRISGDTVLDIELSSLSVSGRVLEEQSGKPLSHVTVQVRGVGAAVDSGIRRTAATDSLGRFFVEGLEPGQYQLVAHKSGFMVATEKLSVPASSEPVLFLAPGEGNAIRVRDALSGRGLRAVTLDVMSDALRIRLNVTLDEKGNGELPVLAAGRYNLFVYSQGYAAKAVMSWSVPGAALDLSLSPGGRLEISVDSAHNGMKASLVDAGGAPPPLMQAEFALIQPIMLSHIAPGEYTLIVKLPEETKRYKVKIFEGETTTLHVK